MFGGWLIKAGGVEIPLEYIQYSSYAITPDQRQDIDSERNIEGELIRNVMEHQPSKIDFTTMPDLNNTQILEINSIFYNAFINVPEKSLIIDYYNPEFDSYKTGKFYMPVVNYPIKQIHTPTNSVIFNAIRYAFIEY